MKSLEIIVVDIDKLNNGDSIEAFKTGVSLKVVSGIHEYLKLIKDEAFGLDNAFLVTDNREASDIAKHIGMGIAVYINGDNNPSDFPEALYCIDNMSEMTEKTLNRMFLRASNLPWEILSTENCIIREITVDDVERLYEIYSDLDVKRYIEDLYEDIEEEIQYTKDYIANQYRFYEYGLWIVINKETQEIIGRAGIFDRADQSMQELGFVFAKEYWGKGYAYECLSAIIDYAYEELSLDKICAHVVNENEKSKRLLQKLGFNYICKNLIDGKYLDMYVLEIQ